ncbi:MAG: hypothetical protein ACE5QV_03715 [Fidelibacterota bacterium]
MKNFVPVRGDIEFLNDVKEAIGRIELYIEKIDYEEFNKIGA